MHIDLKDYKIFVFDLDNTLYLHKANPFYAKKYHEQVKNFLVNLKNNDKILYIATHNMNPDKFLSKLNIQLLFNGIIKETKKVNPIFNSIFDYTSKKDMIFEILDKHIDFIKNDVIFFDDHIHNISEIQSINVKSILVDKYLGINFSEIY